MIFPGAGSTPGWDYDYVQAVGTESIAGYGKNWTDFWSNTDDMPELKIKAVKTFNCLNLYFWCCNWHNY